MTKQKKNLEVRSSLRALLGAIFLLAIFPMVAQAQEATDQEIEDQEALLLQEEQDFKQSASLDEILNAGDQSDKPGKGSLAWKYEQLQERPTDELLGFSGRNIAEIRQTIAKANAALAANDLNSANSYLNPNPHVVAGNINSLSAEAQMILLILKNRDGLTGNQAKRLADQTSALAGHGSELDLARASLAIKRKVAERQAEGAIANPKLNAAQAALDRANTHYASAAAVYSEGHLERAKNEAFEAQKALVEATEILVALKATDTTVDFDAAQLLRRAAVLRLHLHSRLAEAFSLLGQKNPEKGEAYISIAILELRMALANNLDRATEAIDEKGAFVDELALRDHFETETTLVENCAQSDYIIQPGDEDKLRKGIDTLSKILDETMVRAKTSVNELIPDLSEHDLKVQVALKSGQVFLQNARYAQARECFEQALIEDPYCLAAIRALAKIDEMMESAANEKLQTIIKDRMAEVRWKWSDPVTPLMAGSADYASTQTIRKNDDIQGINKSLDDIVIQNLVIDNETLKDVLTEILPREIKKADPEGIGINIVPMLVPMADAGMPGYTPAGYLNNSEGGSGMGASASVSSSSIPNASVPSMNMNSTYMNPYGSPSAYGGSMGGYNAQSMGAYGQAGGMSPYGGDFGQFGQTPVQDAGLATGESLEDKLVNLNLTNITPSPRLPLMAVRPPNQNRGIRSDRRT